MSPRALPPLTNIEEPERLRHHRTGPFGVLDIGTTKIVCVIARMESDHTLRVLGFGWQKGRGVRGGGILDIEDSFQHQLARPDRADPVDILPVQRGVELRVDPGRQRGDVLVDFQVAC